MSKDERPAPQDFELIQDALEDLLELKGEALRARIDEVCGDNAWAREILETITPHAEAPIDMQGHVLREAELVLDEHDVEPPPKFGSRYHLFGELGKGSMGVVYIAWARQLGRLVALKVLPVAAAAPAAMARFRQEARLHGRLQHENVAQVFDAGTVRDGNKTWPFIALEFVAGQRLDEYARTQPLTEEGTLRLLRGICAGVAHTHQYGIVHRDLKPANILVVRHRPKIIDFGVARTTNKDLLATTVQTEVGLILGTFDYMSPEQASLEGVSVDHRSDVYSLGVIAYELFEGRLPYRLPHDTGKAIQAIPLIEPSPLTAASRRFRRDLRTILAKAMAKKRTDRYASVEDLDEDLRRVLENEPIVARPATPWYRLAKLVARHRIQLVFVLLLFSGPLAVWAAGRIELATALLAGIVGIVLAFFWALFLLGAARLQRQRASREAAGAKEVNQLVEKIFVYADPAQRGKDAKVIDFLDYIGDELQAMSGVQRHAMASLRQTLGVTYRGLGMYAQAERELRAAATTFEATLGVANLDTLRAKQWLAIVLRERGRERLAEAATLQDQVVRFRRRLLRDDHPDIGTALSQAGLLAKAQGDPKLAEELQREAIATLEGARGERLDDLLIAKGNLGDLLREEERYDEAEGYLREFVEGFGAIHRRDHPETLKARNNLALTVENAGRPKEALKLFGDNLVASRRRLGDEHVNTMYPRYHMGRILLDQRDLAEAEDHLRTAAAVFRAAFEGEGPAVALSSYCLGALLMEWGNTQEAEEHLRVGARQAAVHLVRERLLYRGVKARVAYAECLARLGKPADALQQLSPDVIDYVDRLDPDDALASAVRDLREAV